MQKSLSLFRLGAFYLMKLAVPRPEPYRVPTTALTQLILIRIVFIKRSKDRSVLCTKIKSRGNPVLLSVLK